MEIPVIYKNKDLLVLNKPAGLLMHGMIGKRKPETGQEETLASWLLENYPEVRAVGDDPLIRPGIVHRLDKETSGVLIVPRNQPTFDFLKDLFQRRLVQKTYLALVLGKIKEKRGLIKKPIGIKAGSTKRSTASAKMQKEAVTKFKVIKPVKLQGKDLTLVEVMPKTGRTHQIRVHLASIGHPVVGDKLYGGSRCKLEGLDRQFLHAQSIEFNLPSGERVRFEADLPEELKSLLMSD